MKETITTTKITCDICAKKLEVNHASIFEKHFCKDCCKDLKDYVHLVLYREVPDRRGGYRPLGMYDG